MSETQKTKGLIFTAILGLVMAFYSTAGAQEIESGQESAVIAVSPSGDQGAAVSPSAPNVADTEADAAEGVTQANPAEEHTADTAREVYDALKAGQWLIAFGSALFFLVWGLRFLLAWLKIKWIDTKVGGFVLAFGTAFALATGTALVAGQGLSVGLFLAAAMAAWGAAGKHGHIKDVLESLRGDS